MAQKLLTGILGGSFDPPHRAHIALAEACVKELGLAEVFFLPASQAPLRLAPTLTPPAKRLEMLKLSLENFTHPARISEYETAKGGVSYAIDTLRHLKAAFKEREFIWIIGSDHLEKLPKWKDAKELFATTAFACAMRPDYAAPKAAPAGAQIRYIPFEMLDISSSKIREAFKLQNLSYAQFALDKNVFDYIIKEKLYR